MSDEAQPPIEAPRSPRRIFGVSRSCLLTLTVILFVLSGCFTLVNYELSSHVWTTRITEELSPDGAWKAVVDETVVEPGFGGASITDEVDVVSTRDPPRRAEVLGVDTGGHDEDRPRIAWTGLNILRVTIDNLSYVTPHRLDYEDVAIDLRFDPDDPPARAAWLRRRNAFPEQLPDPAPK